MRFTTGDILAEDAEALVNTVNCVGVMGKGVALQFKKAFPENFRAYAKACQRGEVKLSAMFVFRTGALANPQYIINFPTKHHWRGNSHIGAIDAGLKDLVHMIGEHSIRSIALPPLGCGLGGLDWGIVRPRIEAAFSCFNGLDVVVFEPQPVSDAQRVVRSYGAPEMTPGRAALVGLMDRYLRCLLDPFVTLLEVHKLMYFMQAAGEPLKLKFRKGWYGPYAENLRYVLRRLEGHFILGFADGEGDKPSKPLKLLPHAVKEAEAVLNRSEAQATRQRFERVAALVEGFESSFGLELLATVHWVLKHEAPRSHNELVTRIHEWNNHKTHFYPRQIALAADVMAKKGWQ